MVKTHLTAPNPAPMYVLLVFVICVCAFFFWVGTVCVRLLFYKGALGPAPERFIIIPLHRKQKSGQRRATQSNNRITLFPDIAHVSHPHSNPFSDEHETPQSKPYFTTIPTINIQVTDKDCDDSFANDFENPAGVRRCVAEERCISRLPAFDQDDCGDGSEFPDVPFATNPIEALPSRGLGSTMTYLQLGLHKVPNTGKWLTIDNSYIELHEARTSLLERKRAECVQVQCEGEVACGELMDQVVQHLCVNYPDHFTTKSKNTRRHIRNEIASEDISLARPFEYQPLEICARLAIEDFNIFTKDEFTLQWYLQASATLFPAGWTMRPHMGKSLSGITNDMNDPMPIWHDLPAILILVTSPTTLFTRTSTYIQTRPTSTAPIQTSLFIKRPADFFSGNVSSLLPQNLYIRREHQSFRLLPKCDAVVMSTRTELRRLTELHSSKGKRELMDEVGAWGEEEAVWKGRDLWMRAVRGWCEGREVWHDDRTVVDAGDLTTVGEN